VLSIRSSGLGVRWRPKPRPPAKTVKGASSALDVAINRLPPQDAYRWLTMIVVPRPIAWVSTRSPEGILNAAPFSFFTVVAYRPPMVGITLMRRAGQPKDTWHNIEATGEYVINLITEFNVHQANRTSIEAPPGFNEFEYAGITPKPSRVVSVPGILESPVQLECRWVRSFDFGESDAYNHPTRFIVGEVVHLSVDDQLLEGGKYVDMTRLRPVGRLGGPDFARILADLHLARPKYPDDA
jgi:flavin reductase (DIM6/NTAB) family NADH-FMN oxidoreductase RutF